LSEEVVSIKTFGEAAADITRTTTTFRPGNYGLDFQPRLLFINLNYSKAG